MIKIYNRKNFNRSILQKFLFCVVCSVLSALIISVACAELNYVKSKEKKGKFSIENSWLKKEGHIDGHNGKYIVSEDGGKITINFPSKMYVNKLEYQYQVPESIEEGCHIYLYAENIYGEEEIKCIKDDYFFAYSPRSVVNIKSKVSKIILEFPEMNAELELHDFVINNAFRWNPLLAVMIGAFIFILFYLVVFCKQNANHPEIAAFVCMFILGGLILILQLPFCSGWDEQIHFVNCYDMAVTSEIEGTPNVLYYIAENAPWLNEHNTISIEERLDLIRIMNEKGELLLPHVRKYSFQLSSVGYIFQAIGISIGEFLGLPFYFTWLLGKLGNLLLYSIGMTFAISIVPVGKRLLSVISILPIMLFCSTIYTYDITVNVFITIGCCIWMKEVIDKEKIFSLKWRIIFFSCLIIGCMPKAVYAPLLLSVFCLPSSKFYSLRDKWIFRCMVVLCFIVLMSTFVLPALLSPSVVADTRGGDTSVSRQMVYIFSMPVSYGIILLKNICHTFVDYTTGYTLGRMSYIGFGTLSPLYGMLMIGVTLTDSYSDMKTKCALKVKDKMISLAAIFMTIILIWTALYLSFTEVGKTEIIGVQGRYYLPFLFLLYMCLRTEKIKSMFSKVKYQLSVMLISCIMLMSQIVSLIFVNSCI